MKKFLLPFLTLISAFSIHLMGQQYKNAAKVTALTPCSDFHKKSCLHLPDEGFAYNAQSHSSFFIKGQPSSVKAVFFRGMDYHISVCTEDKSPANFIIKDAKTGEVLYDNAKDKYTEEVQISNENTRNVKIEVTLMGAKDLSAGDQQGVCAGMLIEHRKSDANGF